MRKCYSAVSREKALLLEILGLEQGTSNAATPPFVKEVDFDLYEWNDYAVKKLYKRNRDVYNTWSVYQRAALAYWWVSFWDAKCQIIGGDVSDTEMIWQISKEGFKLIE